eukprot:1637289-Pyramimonas_sp.AAC.1
MAAMLCDRMGALSFMTHVVKEVALDRTGVLICLTELFRYDKTPLIFRTTSDVSDAKMESAAHNVKLHNVPGPTD